MMFNSKEPNNTLRSLLETRKVQKKIPIWFMRQAGRYLPEYHKAMDGVTNFLQACYNPPLVEEITLQPIQRFNLDAAIIFSDIMTLPDAMGFEVDFPRGKAPHVYFDRRKSYTIENSIEIFAPILESMRNVRKKLDQDKALIGFIGAPWTLASYILGKEKNTKEIVQQHRSGDNTLKTLLTELEELSTIFLAKQVEAGADVLQIFDSLAGDLPHDLFNEFVLLPTLSIIQKLRKTHPFTPIIGFPKGAGTQYIMYSEKSGVDATCVDYSVPPCWIRDNIRGVVQGNLDPTIVAANAELAIQHTKHILKTLAKRPLIFNLGHGVLPSTPPRNIELIVETVRTYAGD